MSGEGGQRVRPDSDSDFVAGLPGPDDVAVDVLPREQLAAGATDPDGAHVGGQRAQVGDGQRGAERAHDEAAGTIGAVSLSRIAWLTTVVVAAVTGVIVLLNGYTGYGVLTFVVGASAAINLR